MKRLAIIAAILTSASAAYAQGWYRPYNNNPQPYHYGEHEHWRGGWEPLAERYQGSSVRQDIELAPNSRPFHRIRIEAVEGRPKIDKVVIEFGSGPKQYRTRQIVNLYRPLEGYNRARDIEVNGGERQINRIVVYADPRFGGEYSVFGT
jgi:hypothetical protein